MRSIKWQKLAPQVCGGPAANKWAKKARDSKAKAGNSCKTTYRVMRSGAVMWCAVCGAYADTTPKLLTQACRGDPEGTPHFRGILLQRNRLLKCVHPVTKKQLPPPVLVQASSLVVTMREARDAAETLKPIMPPPLIEDDGTKFSRAILRRGGPQNGD